MSRLIALSQNKAAIVDDADYDWLSQWKWSAWYDPTTKGFYAVRNIPNPPNTDTRKSRKKIHMSKQIMEPKDNKEVDHVNLDTLDNRRSNLRECTHVENMWNQPPRSDSKSGFRGVSYDRGKWRASIKVHDARIQLGRFDSVFIAAYAYHRAAEEFFGRFAHL